MLSDSSFLGLLPKVIGTSFLYACSSIVRRTVERSAQATMAIEIGIGIGIITDAWLLLERLKW